MNVQGQIINSEFWEPCLYSKPMYLNLVRNRLDLQNVIAFTNAILHTDASIYSKHNVIRILAVM